MGKDVTTKLKDVSITLYKKASECTESKGIIIADTKFKLGSMGDEIILIDEVLTPDLSRFWPKDEYESARSQPSFDKQFVRDCLETLDWNKTHPAPELPEEVVNETIKKYLKVLKMITGEKL
jgi:phosphoribosylaminoimidazole-succinocarboxamide synthase